MNIGKRLKNYRELTGMTQQEVAQRMHITRQCLANWEIDKREPGLEQLVELCKIYGIGLQELTEVKSQEDVKVTVRTEVGNDMVIHLPIEALVEIVIQDGQRRAIFRPDR